MLDAFLFIGLPYIAFFVMVLGSIHRYRSNRFSYTARSSQFLEGPALKWGSIPWHVGVLVLLLGHLIPILLPTLWQSLTSNQVFLITVEGLGIIAAFLALFGLAVLTYRRLTSAKVQAVTTPADLLVIALLMAQILVGISVAAGYRWGASWSTNTTTPYLWSLLYLQPRTELILGLPSTVKLHLVMAWLIFLSIPFTRLVHIFSVPLGYLWRPPIKVIWTNARRFQETEVNVREADTTRRHFVRGMAAATMAAALLSIGALDKFLRFFQGPRMSRETEAEILQKKLERLEMAAQERELELERIEKSYIFVAGLSELSERDGKYFTDYQMRPALAFRNQDGLPILISAKCTHLGCTVASTLDSSNRLLCPCHISYFDVHSGKPNPGSPAKAPLPILGWVLMDPAGEIVASQGPEGTRTGEIDLAKLEGCGVYIAKQFGETA